MGMAQMAMGDPNQEILAMLQQQAVNAGGPGMMQGIEQGVDATKYAFDAANAMRTGGAMPTAPTQQAQGGLLSLLGRLGGKIF